MNAGRSCTRLSAHTTTKIACRTQPDGVPSARPAVGRREETGFVVPRAVNISERLDREKTSTRLAHVVEGVACWGAWELDKLDPSRPETGQSRDHRHRPEPEPEPATRQLRLKRKKERERRRKIKEKREKRGSKRRAKRKKERKRPSRRTGLNRIVRRGRADFTKTREGDALRGRCPLHASTHPRNLIGRKPDHLRLGALNANLHVVENVDNLNFPPPPHAVISSQRHTEIFSFSRAPFSRRVSTTR